MTKPVVVPQAFKHGACAVCGHGLTASGRCLLFPFHSQECYGNNEVSANSEATAEPEIQGEDMDTIDATLSVVQPDGTMSEPVPFRAPVDVDPETGEVGQMVLGDDPAFVRPTRRRDVSTVKVTFAGTVELEQEEFEALTDGKELAPGRVVYIRASAYMPGPHTAWVKRTEKDEDTGERESWWEHQGRLALKVTEIGGLDVTDREWSDD